MGGGGMGSTWQRSPRLHILCTDARKRCFGMTNSAWPLVAGGSSTSKVRPRRGEAGSLRRRVNRAQVLLDPSLLMMYSKAVTCAGSTSLICWPLDSACIGMCFHDDKTWVKWTGQSSWSENEARSDTQLWPSAVAVFNECEHACPGVH